MISDNLTNASSDCGSPSIGGVPDLTFKNPVSLNETKYIVQAVGDVLLEIQNFISAQNEEVRGTFPSKEKRSASIGDQKRAKFRKNKMLSDDKINPRINNINEPTEQTYHRRILDSVVSTNKKPINCENGSLDWKEIPSNNFNTANKSTFKCQEIESRRPQMTSALTPSLSDNAYSAKHVHLSISTFVTSFYKHYPIISHSSFILSMIYIDRFIKSQ